MQKILLIACISFSLSRYASASDYMTTDELLLFLEAEQGVCRLIFIVLGELMQGLHLWRRMIKPSAALGFCHLS